MPPIELTATCVAVLALGALLAVAARRRTTKQRAAALGFLAAVPPLLAIAVAQAVLLAPWAALPLGTVAALCAAAGWVFWPTRGTRFADFERAFWAHVGHGAPVRDQLGS